jgi:hypothetical protein
VLHGGFTAGAPAQRTALFQGASHLGNPCKMSEADLLAMAREAY